MRKRGTLIGASLGVAAAFAPAQAQEDGGLQLRLGFDQRIEADDNLGLDPESAGTTVTATTRLSFRIASATPVDSFTLDASTALRASDGPDGTETFFDDQRLGLGYVREGARARFEVNTNYRRTRIDFLRPLEEFLDSGVIVLPEDLDDLEGTGSRVSYTLGSRLDLGIDTPFGLTLDTQVSALDYEDVSSPDLVPVRRLNLGAAARLALSPVMAGTALVRRTLYEADDVEETERITDKLEVGLNYEVSPILRTSAGLGYSVLDVEEFGITDRTEGAILRLGLELDRPNGRITADLDSRLTEDGIRQNLSLSRSLELPRGALSAEIGLTGIEWRDFESTAALSWQQELPSGGLSAQLRRSVLVNSNDSEELVTALSLGYNYEINVLSAINLGLTYTVSDEGDANTSRGSFTATYRHALTENWSLDGGYRVRTREEQVGGSATSNAVFLGIGRSFER